ncbi:MAG: alpha/beta hydrolase, partial [Pseudomonadota bacterium]
FFFGSSRRRLFGLYNPARGARGRDRAALLCYPWGHEYIYAHRSMTRLAFSLAEAGIHVLRFDYYGTGDSAGEMTEASLAGWREDIATAIEELSDMSGAERVSLIGLRLGATLAARVAAEEPRAVEAVALWDPVVSGAEYRDWLFHAAAHMPIGAAPPPERPGEAGGGHEVVGFPLTEAMEAEIAEADILSSVQGLPPRLLAVATQPVASHGAFGEALAARTPPAALEMIEDKAAWHEDWPLDAGMVPVQVLDRLVRWMS